MTVEEVQPTDLRFSGKPGRSFRRSKEDLALFESINDLPDSNDLDSCLADVDPNALAGDQLLEKDSDTDKNDDDWLVPAPELSVSPQSLPIISRNLTAIKTTRSATLEPARVSCPSPRVSDSSPRVSSPSPRVYKGPQESKISPSRIPRFDRSASNSTVRKSAPGPSLIPRAASSPRASTSSSIPRAASSPRASAPSAILRAASSPRASAPSPSAIPRASSSPRTTASASGIRPPSPKSKWTTSTKTTTPVVKSTSQTPKALRGTSPKFTRASSTSPSVNSKGRGLSSGYGSARITPSSKDLPSQPGSARSVKSVGIPNKASFVSDSEFLAETPAKRSGTGSSLRSLHARSLSRSYDGLGYTGSTCEEFASKSPDRGPSDLSRSQDQGVSQSSQSSDEDFVSKIPAFSGGIGRRTLKKDDQSNFGSGTVLFQHDKSTSEDYSFIMGGSSMPDPFCSTADTAQAQSSMSSKVGFKPFITNSFTPSFSQHRKLLDPDFMAPQPVSTTTQDPCEDKSSWDATARNRFGCGMEEPQGCSADETGTVKRIQMGFVVQKGDVVAKSTVVELPASVLIDTASASTREVAIPHLSTTAMVSHVEDKSPVKIYQGLGDIEDMEDMGGNWCCGMADRYRSLCKQHDCVIFNNFHSALVLNNETPEKITQPCLSSEESLNENSSISSESDDEAISPPEQKKKEESPHKAPQPIDSTPISEFLQQLEPLNAAPGCSDSAANRDSSSSPKSDVDSDEGRRKETTVRKSLTNRDSSSSPKSDVDSDEGRRKDTTVWKLKSALKSPEETSPQRRPKVDSGKKKGHTYNKWDLDNSESISSRPRQLGKPPDFFDVTKRNVEDGGVVAAISSVKSMSASECSDEKPQMNRSASMNGSHVSHSDSDDEEDLRAVARAFSPESMKRVSASECSDEKPQMNRSASMNGSHVSHSDSDNEEDLRAVARAFSPESVKRVSTSECSDEKPQMNRSANMNGSHVSHSDSDDEEDLRAVARAFSPESVKRVSTSECSDEKPQMNRSANMNGSHVSHSDSDDEEDLRAVARAFSPESVKRVSASECSDEKPQMNRRANMNGSHVSHSDSDDKEDLRAVARACSPESVKRVSASECSDEKPQMNRRANMNGSHVSHSDSDDKEDLRAVARACSPESVKRVSASECSDEKPHMNRSDCMNGSHVSHSDSDNEEDLRAVAHAFSPESDVDDLAASDSDKEGSAESSAVHGSESHSDDQSPREFSRSSSTKSNVRRFLSTSAISIDLTRSIDTTCSAHEYNIWEEPSDSGRYGFPTPAPSQKQPEKVENVEVEPAASVYDYGLEKLAGYIRSASVNARKRRASMTSSESDQSKISLSRESSFDYFVDFFEAQTNLDPEARVVADLLVSAHIEAKRVEFSAGSSSNLKRMSSLLSNCSLRSDKSGDKEVLESTWESNKSIQTLEKTGDGTEQIVENATLASMDKHFSSFKFGQKKYPAGEFESITTLEVVPESPLSDSAHASSSRRRYSMRFNEIMSSEPSPICQKFLKEIEEQQNLCEGIALSALKSAPLEPVVIKSVEQVRHPKPEEESRAQARPASPAESPLIPKCESPRVPLDHPSNEIQVGSSKKVETVDSAEKGKESKLPEQQQSKGNSDEEPDEIEKAVVEQVLLPPVPSEMSKGGKDTPSDMSPIRMPPASPTKPANNGHAVVVHRDDKTCGGCMIL